MRDTLVIAISQSGTTTDTNRTVDLARARGAVVIAIVNRRQSDLVDKSDGVLYTSDGRDVEMSVASTKAFYAQLAAGVPARVAPGRRARRRLRIRSHAAQRAARRAAPAPRRDAAKCSHAGRRSRSPRSGTRSARRSWAVVGNGVNRTAAQELRIKLSELCYKSIACDVTEDKKHIDLSSEPMILVCAAGLHGSNADDVAKEVAIYRAHKAAPIVIADDGETALRVAAETISVPVGAPVARLRAVRARRPPVRLRSRARDRRVGPPAARGARLHRGTGRASTRPRPARLARRATLEPLADRFFDGLRAGGYDGSLEARTAVQLASLLRYAIGMVAARRVPDRVRQGRHAERRRGGSHRRAHQGDRRADSPGRRDQAPGEDRHRRHLALRRDAAPGPARARGARDRHGTRQPHLRRAAHAGGARRRGRLGDRLDALPHRGRCRPGAPRPFTWSTGAASRATSRRVPTTTRRCAARSTASRPSARSRSGAAAPTSARLIFVPEVKGTQTTGITLLHVRFLDRLPPTRRAACSRATATATRPSPTR